MKDFQTEILVKNLKKYAAFYPKRDRFNLLDIVSDCGVAADTIEQLLSKLEEKENGWIKCIVRMPEQHEEFEDQISHMTSDVVLVTVYDGNRNVVFVSDDFLVNDKCRNRVWNKMTDD